jgi:hypothetical protein
MLCLLNNYKHCPTSCVLLQMITSLTRYVQCVYFWRHKHKVKFTHCFCSCIDWRTRERRRLRNTDYLAVTKLLTINEPHTFFLLNFTEFALKLFLWISISVQIIHIFRMLKVRHVPVSSAMYPMLTREA